MTRSNFVLRAAIFRVPVALVLAALALTVAGCGRSEKEQLADSYCPTPFKVQDASTITRFRPGSGRDARDVVFQGEMGEGSAACALRKNYMELTLKIEVAAVAGPSIGSEVASVPYFVRVLDGSGRIVQGREFDATFKLSQSRPRGASLEELTLRLPFDKPADVAYYRIAIGLKPTQEELDYNRSGIGR